MSNIEKVSEALSEWGMNIAKSVLPRVAIPPTSGIGKMMNFLGVDVRNYSLYDELGFIIEPTIRLFLEPKLTSILEGVSEEQVKDIAMMYAEAFHKQAVERGYINVFGVQLGADAFDGLKNILQSKFY